MKHSIMQENKYTNHLINESSPYLLQHAHNPVDWYPWSEEALVKARTEDKPIFLSIGYAACHWCHVMERESFENEEIAKLLNENFISIKVDREQRPDIDQIYMAATIAMNGSGGWPMSVFLTPDLKPFFAGTYFPPEDGYGRPGFKSVIRQIAVAYNNGRQNIEAFAQRLSYSLDSTSLPVRDTIALDKSAIKKTADMLMAGYDSTHGGFGGAPKFPHATDLSFLLKIYSGNNDKMMLHAVEHTLQSMARGGLYDQIGGGFHRYSTDEKWLVPHFEKMLYDNAMLAITYSEAYQVTGNKFYKKIAEETLDFLIREMQDKKGGFYSSLDADSEAEEGKFYTWTKSEIDNLLGEESDIFCTYYNIAESGNFEDGKNIPNINRSSDDFKKAFTGGIDSFEHIMENQKQALFRERSKRIRPFTDDKILTSWNGLAISGLSRGYQITGKEEYRTAATRAAEFIYDNMNEDGLLVHSYRDGKTSSGPFLEDYAYLVRGLIDLYETTYDYRWIESASKLADEATRQFTDMEGHLYLSPPDQADHFMRPRDEADGALPAPGSVLIESLLKLADITGNKSWQTQAEKSLTALSGSIARSPLGMISAVTALNYLLSDRYELILVGKKNRDEFTREIHSRYFPNRVIVISDKGKEDIALLEGRQSNGKTMAYICKNSVCLLPAESVDELKSRFDELALRN